MMKRPGSLSSSGLATIGRSTPWPVLANAAWLRGSPDQARRLNLMSIAEARQLDHAVPLCVALAWASFNTYLISPDDPDTEALANELVEHAAKYTVESYHGFGLSMQALCRVRRGEGDAALPTLIPRFGEAVSSALWGLQLDPASGVCKMYSRRRSTPAGLAVFERAKINLDETQCMLRNWRRIRGELALGNDEGLAVARQLFSVCARIIGQPRQLVVGAQGCDQPSYCRKSVGRKEAAWRALQATHAKFREGLETLDLRLAKQVLTVSNLHAGVTNAMN